MLAQENRLRTASDYRLARRKAQRVNIPGAMLTVLKTNGKVSQYGVIVPNKVVKTAVERNSIKRKIRHIFREHAIANPTGYSIVVQVTDNKKLNIQEIKNQLA